MNNGGAASGRSGCKPEATPLRRDFPTKNLSLRAAYISADPNRPSVAGSVFEEGEIGPDLFRKACEFGLEGLVSMHRDRPYPAVVIKVKNRTHPAMSRVM